MEYPLFKFGEGKFSPGGGVGRLPPRFEPEGENGRETCGREKDGRLSLCNRRGCCSRALALIEGKDPEVGEGRLSSVGGVGKVVATDATGFNCG